MRPWSNKSICFGITGLFLVGLGTTLLFFGPTIFHAVLQKEMTLSPQSRSFDVWRSTNELPAMYMHFYFFNWTNPEEISIPGTKPNLVELGPYVFREVREKVNITFNLHNDTVSYLQRKFWWFDPIRSNGSLQDNITQLNVVAVSGARKLRDPWLKMAFQRFLMATSMQLYVVKTVDELLFSGYTDNLITIGQQFAGDDVPPFDRFGWFYKRNGSTEFDGHFNMDTGKRDISNLGVLRKWNYKDTIKYFRTPCNVIEGSAGEFWPPYRQKDEITLFTADLCRPLTYEYSETTEHMGLEGYKYELGEKTLGNTMRKRFPHDLAKYFETTTTTEDFFDAEHSVESTDPPEQEDPDVINMGNCYCNGECSPSGLLNISACRFGAPAFVSLPHFHKADPALLQQVTGLKPNHKEHSFYIILEPSTGIPLEVSARLQVNILVQETKGIDFFKGVPKTYFPMFWFSMKAGITPDLAEQLQLFVQLPAMCLYMGIGLVVIGTAILFGIALAELSKQRNLGPLDVKPGTSTKKSSEHLYLDKVNSKDDAHVRSDRRLYPKQMKL